MPSPVRQQYARCHHRSVVAPGFPGRRSSRSAFLAAIAYQYVKRPLAERKQSPPATRLDREARRVIPQMSYVINPLSRKNRMSSSSKGAPLCISIKFTSARMADICDKASCSAFQNLEFIALDIQFQEIRRFRPMDFNERVNRLHWVRFDRLDLRNMFLQYRRCSLHLMKWNSVFDFRTQQGFDYYCIAIPRTPSLQFLHPMRQHFKAC